MNTRRVGGWIVVLTLPLIAIAGVSGEQEFLDATRARPDVAHGGEIFDRCAACHGPQGLGSSDDSVPRIAGQNPRVIIRQLIDYRFDRRIDPQMEAVAARHGLKTQDLVDVAAFVATLRPEASGAMGRGENLEQAHALYAARCSTCHGSTGLGSDRELVPRLAGQHYMYLLRQFHDALEGRRPLLAGSHEKYWRDLDRDALQGLADLMSRMDGTANR